MNTYVDEIVGALFEKAGDTEEVRALREEISDNCREHFNDLVAQGLSPEEAALEIKESLKGIEEVIDEIARSNDATDGLPSEIQPCGEEVVLAKDSDSSETMRVNVIRLDGNKDFGADGIRRVEFGSGSVDLSVEPSPDGAIHLIPDPDNGVIAVYTQVKDGILNITAEHREKEWSEINNSVGGTISELLKKVFSGVSITVDNAVLRLLLPENAPEIWAKTTSGDIRLNGIGTPSLKVSNTSGDIRICPEGKIGSCVLETRSGDIRFEGSSAAFNANCMSGDVSIKGDFETCSAQSCSGDINAGISGEKISLSTASGDIELRCRANSAEVKSTSGDIEAAVRFTEGTFSSTSGDITLRTEDAYQLQRLSVNTVSGDVLVHLPAELNAHVNFKTVSGDSKNNHGGGAIGEASVNLRSVSGDLTVR